MPWQHGAVSLETHIIAQFGVTRGGSHHYIRLHFIQESSLQWDFGVCDKGMKYVHTEIKNVRMTM